MNKLVFFLLFQLLAVSVIGQTRQEVVQQRIEFISEQLESEEVDLTDVTASLNYYLDHPLNLNSATREQLQELGLLTDVQINDLLLHRKLFGKFISVYELQVLKYWDLSVIQLVLPFIRIDDKLDQVHLSLKEALKYGKFEVFLRYQTIPEPKAGYERVPDSVLQTSNKYYYGNADRYYARFRYSYRTNISIGVTAEKDPGEQFFRGAQKNGFDFYSAHAYYKGGKYLRGVAVGDFQVQLGQAVNFWSGYAFNKTADVTNIKKNAQALRPYTSVDESRFMRGVGIDLGYKNWGLTLFGSQKRVDGSVVSDSLLDEFEFVSSINLSGLHRTNSEIERKHTLTERILGSNLRYQKGGFQAGVAAISQGYTRPFSRDTFPYSQFDFRGKQLTSISADYSYVWRNMNFFGEVSRAHEQKDVALLQGLIVALDSRASLSLMYRNYGKAYHTFYNNAFSEGSRTQNENGIYMGLRVKLGSMWTLNTYYDVFQSKWLKYQVDAPSTGHEFLIQPSFKPSKQLEIYARFRQQLRQKNSRNSDGTITAIEDVFQRNYRLNLSYQVSEAVTLKSRIEYVTIHRASNTPEQGMLFTQDIVVRPKSSPIDLAFRYALFDTDSYDSRLYSFESNALYVFSVPAYYYQGSRAYLMVRYTFLRKFDLWVRYGNFIYSNRTSLSSGSEEITGNRKSDITVQLRMTF